MKSIAYGVGGLVVVGILTATTGCGTLSGEPGGIPCLNLFGWMSSKDDQTCITPANAKYLKEKSAREYAEEQAANAAGRGDQYRAEQQRREEQKEADNRAMGQMALAMAGQMQQMNDQLAAQRMARAQQLSAQRQQPATTPSYTPTTPSYTASTPTVAAATPTHSETPNDKRVPARNECLSIRDAGPHASKGAKELYNTCGEPLEVTFCYHNYPGHKIWSCEQDGGGADTVASGGTMFLVGSSEGGTVHYIACPKHGKYGAYAFPNNGWKNRISIPECHS